MSAKMDTNAMNEPLPEPVTIWRFLRRYSVRIGIGAVLLLVVMIAIRLDAAFRLGERTANYRIAVRDQ